MRFPAACLLALLLSGALGARAQDPGAAARDAVSALGAAEAAARSARLSISVSESRAEYKERERPEDMRKRLAREKGSTASGTFVYGPEGWAKDLTLSGGKESDSAQTRTVDTAGTLAVLVQGEKDGKPQRRARLMASGPPRGADAILARQVAQAVRGVKWTSARVEGGLTTIEGDRADEHHLLALQGGALRRWTITRAFSPGSKGSAPSYTSEVTAGADGSISRVEEWAVNPEPANVVAYRVTSVTRSEPGTLRPADLAIRLAAGTAVSDVRGAAPVEYELLADSPLIDAPVLGGGPAAPFDLKSTQETTVRLADLRGKTAVLLWFSTRSDDLDDVVSDLNNLHNAYKDRPFQWVALNVSGDTKKAESFRKRFKWPLTVLDDTGGQVLRRYGAMPAVPKAAVADAAGSLAYLRNGFDPDEVAQALDRLAAGPQ